MANLSISQKAALDNLLGKGLLQEASKFLAELGGETPAPATPPKEPEPPPEPRKPNEVIVDAFKAVHALLGNNPALDEIIAELEAVLTPPPTPPAA